MAVLGSWDNYHCVYILHIYVYDKTYGQGNTCSHEQDCPTQKKYPRP